MWLMVLGCTSHPSEWWGRYPWFARGLPDWCLVELLGGWHRAVLLGGWSRGREPGRVTLSLPGVQADRAAATVGALCDPPPARGPRLLAVRARARSESDATVSEPRTPGRAGEGVYGNVLCRAEHFVHRVTFCV